MDVLGSQRIMYHVENLLGENFSPAMRLPIGGRYKGTTSMRYKSMVLLFMTMLGIVVSSPGWALASRGCEDTPIKFSELQYMHVNIKLDGKGVCTVMEGVNSDAGARGKCPGGQFLNPGNPQYTAAGHGSRGGNDLGYYFCVKGSSFNKKFICENMPAHLSALNTHWDGRDSTHGDGNCLCGVKGSLRLTNLACEDPEATANNDQKKCEDKKGKYHPSYSSKDTVASCQCLSNNKTIDISDSSTCDDAPPAQAAVDPTLVSDEIKKCVADFEKKLDECKTMGAAAKSKCDQNNETNKPVDAAKKLVKGISDMLIQKSAGSGAQAQCAGASLLGTGTFKLINALKTTCETDISECTSKCDELSGDVQAFCKDKSPQPLGNEEGGSPDQVFLSQENARLKPLVEDGKKLCFQEAPKNRDILKEALTTYDDAARSASVCACKLSANGSNCETLPGPADCAVNPSISPSLCNGPGSINCVVGTSDYTLPKCQCLRDPSLDFCHDVPGKVPFAFANDLKGMGFGGGGGGAFGGGGGGSESGMDLGGLNQQDARTDSKIAPQGDAPSIGVNAAPGGGGGGGGGGGDGAGGPAAEAGGEPAEKSLGIMGMVKNAVGNMFGNKPGSASNNKGSSRGGSPGYDIDKWRPRGLASTGCNISQIRCKNEDIFTIMNKRYLNNEMSFIQNP